VGLQDSESADEIECSSDEDDMSPGFAGTAATSNSARRARRSATLVMRCIPASAESSICVFSVHASQCQTITMYAADTGCCKGSH